MTTILMPWTDGPPLRSNARHHWARKAAIVRSIRRDAALVARASMIRPIAGPVDVRFIWTVTDNRRRDAGASAPTLKAALDGLVDAGLLAGDHHMIVRSETCAIEVGEAAGCRIEIHPHEGDSA